MGYVVDVKFEPPNELLSSLHAYICKKSYKKIDLTESWAEQTRGRLTASLAGLLDQTEADGDWKTTHLLVQLCPNKAAPEDFAAWLDGLTTGDLYDLIAEYGNQFPENMGHYRSKTLSIFSGWHQQYFQHTDPAILDALRREEHNRTKELPHEDQTESFIDETTNGLVFHPMPGLERIILIPSYHFQPINRVFHYGKMTVCYYSARIDLSGEDFLSAHDYRMIRSLGEKSRLKILRYLHQGPRSFIEIVRHLELSKGITHDHISKLRSAGLIRAHFAGETLTVYSLRPGALELMQKKLLEYIGQD
ncbi:ArsR/SmtB family transcription factor [Cohnella pontilimi]|uniref:ArsR/SmtB family transcription factor n=1 Tax=Cohnella pontilimi TaxID=2564100 RepID=UPI001FEB5F5C|nr:winged helix-turn-helix domain-containing protein [Cohnella pontilimi]